MSLLRKNADTTKHEYFEERLSPYLDDELSPQERSVVEHHLATCEDCQWSLETLRQTVQWTSELPTLPVPRVFTIPVPAEPERTRRWRWSLPVLQGATALVALLLFFVVAGDLMLGQFRSASQPEPVTLWEKQAVDVQVTQVVESEAMPAVEEAPVAEPTPSPMPTVAALEIVPTEQVVREVEKEVEAEVAATASPEASVMGAGPLEPAPGEAEAPEAALPAEGAPPEEVKEEPAEADATEAALPPAPAAAETQMIVATEAMEPTPAPTVEPTLAPTAVPTAMAPTIVAAAPEPAPRAADREAATRALQEPLVNWLVVTEITLAVLFVLLATTTAVVMIRRRRTG